MAWWNWSKTAASNASADPTINWAEGQPPASLNDSARAMMARLAEFRDDTSGLLVTGGTATAYTLTTNQGLAATPNDGQLIAFSPHTPNGPGATLVADGGGAFPLQSNPGVALPSASLLQGSPYLARFSAGVSAWIMFSQYQTAFAVPLGGMLPYIGATVPNSSFAFPFGQAISRTTFASLFALTGTAFGIGDGVTTFNIPDLRGRSVFGLDSMGGSAANRITVAGGNFDGTVLGNTGGLQNHTLTTPEIPAHNHTATDSGHSHNIHGDNHTASGSGGNAVPHASSADPFISSGPELYGATDSATANVTIGNTGGGGAHTVLNPAMVVPFILRII